jgi:trigger factor
LKVDYVEESPVKKALAFEVEAERIQQEIDSRARELARKVKLPGFRPGTVPVEVVKRRFRDEILGEAAEATGIRSFTRSRAVSFSPRRRSRR